MNNINFESTIIVLYNVLKNYDSFVDVIWEQCIDDNIENLFEFYEKEIFGSDRNIIEKMTRLHTINACLYVNKNIIPKIIVEKNLEDLYSNTHIKLTKYKTRLREQVMTFANQKNDKKYILKELIDKPNEDVKKFISLRLNNIKKWENSEDSLISDFYYIDELQNNQLKIVLNDEPIFILLKEIFKLNNQSLLDCFNILKMKRDAKTRKKGATVPNSMLEYDGLFTAGKKTISNTIHEEKNGQIFVQLNKSSDKLSIVVPKLRVKNDEIKVEYDSEVDALNFTAGDFKVLTALFELGGDKFLNGKEVVTFTLEDLCNLLQIKPCTKNYNAIAKSIFSFKTKEVYIKISDSHVRIFNIIKTIDVPVLNSDRKKRWTISFHEELIKEIVANKYKLILTETISTFRYEISILLFKIFAYDISNSPDNQHLTYTWDELATKTGLEDKPSRIKDRLKSALNEMVSREIILKYETLENDAIFNIYPRFEHVNKISDK